MPLLQVKLGEDGIMRVLVARDEYELTPAVWIYLSRDADVIDFLVF